MSALPSGSIESDLQDRFGFGEFLPGQRELISAVLAGRDAFGLMPTGGGKSLTYQLPAFRLAGLTVVVSPLIALMKDQVDTFNRRHDQRALAVAIHSGLNRQEASEALGHLHGGRATLLYVAPERMESASFRDRLRGLCPKLLVVDEVHCVSLWGHDFRPSYMRLAELVQCLRPCPVLALTSTATPKTRGDILRQLGLQDPCVFLAPLDRPNLFFRVVEGGDDAGKRSHLLRIVRKVGQGEPQIVYVGRRADAESLSAFLSEEGIGAAGYHAGMAPEDRKGAQERWLAGKMPVIVATVAFGMGIDNPHVRAVTHYQHPASVEGYYQEAGRAGRDRQKADCTILYSTRDTGLQHYFIRNRYPSGREVFDLLGQLPKLGCRAEDLKLLGGSLTPEKQNVALSVLMAQGFVRREEDGTLHRAARAARESSISLTAMYARKDADYRRLEAIEAYCQESACCRANLLRYLGEELPKDYRCGNCSLCLAEIRGTARRGRRGKPAGAARPEYGRNASGVPCPHAASAGGHGLPEDPSSEQYTGRVDGERTCPSARTRKGMAPGAKSKRPELAPGVFWSSPTRSFTMAELKACVVPRRLGVAILKAAAAHEGLLSPSAMANFLRGALSADAIQRNPALAESAEFGAGRESTYEVLLQHVLAMLAKGYLAWALEGRKRVVLTSQGRKVIGGAKG